MNNSITSILAVRLQVSFLGERRNWWQSSFLDNSSRAFLIPVFKKTLPLAQYHGALEAARRVHDQHIGIGNVGHLFRLPEQLEFQLSQTLQNSRDPETFMAALHSDNAAAQALNDFSPPSGQATEGPIKIERSALSMEGLKEIACFYATAFQNDTVCYPYFAINT